MAPMVQSPYKPSRLLSRRQVSGTNVDFSNSKIDSTVESIHRKEDTRGSFMTSMDDPSEEDGFNMKQLALPSFIVLISLIVGVIGSMGYDLHDVVNTIQHFVHNPQTVLEECIDSVQDMGTVGVLYFGLFYVLAEVLAIPALPLTLSAGYLFGLPTGVAVVLSSATIAASIAFLIGKTVLRSWVETILESNPNMAKIDRAIGERGFKLLVLLRLSPIFPFALSNYVYGASSIDFPSYFWSTLIGFAPGTIAYVYTGMVGKELMFNSGDAGSSGQPWYVYAVGLSVLAGLLKVASDVATGILESTEDDSERSDRI